MNSIVFKFLNNRDLLSLNGKTVLAYAKIIRELKNIGKYSFILPFNDLNAYIYK